MTGRKAILVVSFGTSYNETRERTIDRIESRIAEEHPGWDVRRAFTSKMIIRKLEKRDGVKVDYVTDAMDRLITDGYRTVLVQPTHIMNGKEYDDVARIVHDYAPYFDEVSLGTPLLTSEEDYDMVVDAIADSMSKEAEELMGKGTAVVLMGHGTEHYANSAYSQLQMKLMMNGHGNVFVTTVEGFPGFDDTITMLKGFGFTKAVLFPFMLVCGDHANNDMAGDDEDSLKSALETVGIETRCVLKGLGEYDQFEELFLEHAKAAMGDFKTGPMKVGHALPGTAAAHDTLE